MSAPPDVERLAAGVRAGRRADLGRAITLVESERPQDRAHARALLHALAPAAGAGHRIGITGAPGVGKSTLIERLGLHAVAQGHKVAVLAVDPSSARSGGSILGDKTRMQELARHPAAFIRPSPSRGELGGVARRTRETIQVVEAAGYDRVLVETVGVGQSEGVVANLVDTFLLLLMPAGGDGLQGIKRGLLELVDVCAVTKADGARLDSARETRRDYARALHLALAREDGWVPPVVLCSALSGAGVAELWDTLARHLDHLRHAGLFAARRREQLKASLWATLERDLLGALRHDGRVAAALPRVEARVEAGELAPEDGAAELLALFVGPRAGEG